MVDRQFGPGRAFDLDVHPGTDPVLNREPDVVLGLGGGRGQPQGDDAADVVARCGTGGNLDPDGDVDLALCRNGPLVDLERDPRADIGALFVL